MDSTYGLVASSEGVRWLEKAREHLHLAKLALDNGIYSLSCFHSQQAAETALKGVLIAFAGVHLLTHSLVKLVEEVAVIKSLRLPSKDRLEELEDHYLQARYPNARLSSYSFDEAESAYKTAEEVVDECSKLFAENR